MEVYRRPITSTQFARGTTNVIPKWQSGNPYLTDSQFTDNGTGVGLASSQIFGKLDIQKNTATITDETDYGFRLHDGSSAVGFYFGVSSALGITIFQSMDPGSDWGTRPICFQPNGGNLLFGGTAAAPASAVRTFTFTDGTAPTADPTTGTTIWSDSGALKFRSSGSGEGSGGTQFVMNRTAQVLGAGTDYTLTNSHARVDFGTTDAEVTLPTAGTYLLDAIVSVANGATANDVYAAKLYNSSDAADVTGSERKISHLAASTVGQIVLQNVVTVAASKTIQIYARNETAARGTVQSTQTSIRYVRLY